MHQNSGQQLAIDTVEGQLLVIAGPGSGKMTTMPEQIHHMVILIGPFFRMEMRCYEE
ncbi:MAG: UvrD-helicase domain-containing protein [Lachnospiraceae bacterium]|nr:UvrD-helicase domain-containing protein [Lachnospiraceae bacterium]